MPLPPVVVEKTIEKEDDAGMKTDAKGRAVATTTRKYVYLKEGSVNCMEMELSGFMFLR